MTRRWPCYALAPASAWLACAPAPAQAPVPVQAVSDYYARDRNISVTERRHPELDPTGLWFGTFVALPSVTLAGLLDDNIYAAPARGRVGDAAATIAADLSVASNWARNGIDLRGGINRLQYKTHGRESTTTYNLAADGRLDLHAGQIAIAATTDRLTQARSDVDAPDSARSPIRYQRSGAMLDATDSIGRLLASGAVAWQRFRFDDAISLAGDPLPQHYRNRDVLFGRLRAAFALDPRVAFYLESSANQRRYPVNEPNRGSHGYTVEAGFDVDLTRLVRGHIQFGGLVQHGAMHSWRAKGASGRGRIEVFATPVLTATIEGGRTVEDTAETDSPAYLSTFLRTRADYELLRSLILNVTTGVTWDKFLAIEQRARRFSVGFGARYRWSRTIQFELTADHLGQASAGSTDLRGFRDNRLLLSLRLQR